MGTVKGFITLRHISMIVYFALKFLPGSPINNDICTCYIATESACQEPSNSPNLDREASPLQPDVSLLCLWSRENVQQGNELTVLTSMDCKLEGGN